MNPLLKTLLFSLLIIPMMTQAQTKVFKEVADSVSSSLQIIRQDGNLVGYLVFTQLERVSADSFNYRLSIMDENLNDIGSVNFHEERLLLQSVAFEQDVICLVYVKSNYAGKEFRSNKEFRRQKDNFKEDLFAQFVDLHGKILNKYTERLDVKADVQESYWYGYKTIKGSGRLKQQVQMSNVAGKGFAVFYGDDNKNNLLIFNANGNLYWKKTVKDVANSFTLLTSGQEVSLLMQKKDKMEEGGYEVASYNAVDTTTYPKFLLKDRKGNSLKVLAFGNDPTTGKPFVSGLVIDPVKGNARRYIYGMHYMSGRNLRHGPYSGVFSIALNGHKRNDIQASFSYWADGSQGETIDKYGYYEESRGYAYLKSSFRDFEGNTWFTGDGIHRRFRAVAVGVSVATCWSIVIPAVLMGGGTHSYVSRKVLLLKQDPKGKLTVEKSLPAFGGFPAAARWRADDYANRTFYTVSNSDTKTNYLVVDDQKNIVIYNTNQNKVARTIPHKDGNSFVAVFPAKEGHVMISEYNQKERQTRFSIEAL